MHLNEHKKAVFFDVDDTLYDHLTPFRRAVDEIAHPAADFPYEAAYHRMRYYSDILSLELGGAGSQQYEETVEEMRRRRFQLALQEFGIELSSDQAKRMQAAYIGCQYDIQMFARARELLKQLADDGHIIGLITNGPLEHQMNKIAAMNLGDIIPDERLFVSGAVGWDKPDARIFAYVNEKTGTRPENSFYVGDSWRNDVIGALNAGWHVIWFNHRRAKPESEHTPHYTATSYEELGEILKARL
ncbi:HAD family hydrolase [Paenibacillus dakarensis]|uniref:HAD family hydrolase n=1 Tax=Paenibacillus dakarensis TaxID=1527293 RepID=UPI0006D55AD2|nr:HAD family hydrolase [Paenibacillus dakarensis]